jgi:hypothetical protein
MKTKRYIQVNKDFLDFIGWYIAEGSNQNGKGIELDFHSKEVSVATRLASTIEKLFGIEAFVDINGKNKCRTRCSGGIISDFLGKFCGVHAWNKKIPDILYPAYKDITPLVKGLIFGDGCIQRKDIAISLTSRETIWRLRDILLANNIYSSLSSFSPRSHGKHMTWRLSINGIYHDRLCSLLGISNSWVGKRHRAEYVFETKDMFYTRVYKVEKTDTSEVIDIAVKDIHSFTGNGVLLHNTTVDAMAVGLPIIAPNNTTFPEILDGNGYIYPCKEKIFTENSGMRPIGRLDDILEQMFTCYNDWRDYRKQSGIPGMMKGNSLRREKYIQNNKEFVNKYSWANVGKQWVALFDKIIVTPPKSSFETAGDNI